MDPGLRRDDNLWYEFSITSVFLLRGMPDHTYFVYILASRKNGTLYIGVTNNLERRIWEHRQVNGKSFTSRYKVDMLVYIESYTLIEEAIAREKALKNWQRAWKIRLIEASNPDWQDLAADWFA